MNPRFTFSLPPHTTYYIQHTASRTATFLHYREGSLVPVHGSLEERMIGFLTNWILKAFSAIAPKSPGCNMGTVVFGGKEQVFLGVLFLNFRKILLFSCPTYPAGSRTTYDLLLPDPHSLHPRLRSAHSAFGSAQSAIRSAHFAFRSAQFDNRSAQSAYPLSPQHKTLSQKAPSLSSLSAFALFLEAKRS